VLVIAALSLVPPASILADSPAPQTDYIKTTPSGEYIFVMLVRENDTSTYNQTGMVVKKEEIRSKYSRSGLYRNDGSSAPLWTVDWYSFGVFVFSDGVHLVKFGPWALSNNYSELALAFYRSGEEIERYSVSALVANPSSLPHSVSHYMWGRSSSFDDHPTNRLHVETYNGERYIFDVTSGQIISKMIGPVSMPTPIAPSRVYASPTIVGRATTQASPTAVGGASSWSLLLAIGVISVAIVIVGGTGLALWRRGEL
jgi:hypothetical protein